LSVIWVGGLDLDRSRQRGGNGSSLGAASGNVDDVKQSVRFETSSGGDVDLAVGDGRSGKMADRWKRVAPMGGLIRGIEQLEKGHLSCDEWDPVSESSAACNPSADTGRARIGVAEAGLAA